jgi:hypothetical protein
MLLANARSKNPEKDDRRRSDNADVVTRLDTGHIVRGRLQQFQRPPCRSTTAQNGLSEKDGHSVMHFGNKSVGFGDFHPA